MSAEQTTVEVLKDHPAQVAEFGCNGKSPQGAYALNAALSAPSGTYTQSEITALTNQVNKLRLALIAAGICS